MSLIWRTENVQIGTGATTFTHGLGVAPAGSNGEVRITKRTNTGEVYVDSSNSQIVVLKSSVANAAVDVAVQIYHSIIK